MLGSNKTCSRSIVWLNKPPVTAWNESINTAIAAVVKVPLSRSEYLQPEFAPTQARA